MDIMTPIMKEAGTAAGTKIGTYLANRAITYLKTPKGKFKFEFTERISFYDAMQQDIIDEALIDILKESGGKKDRNWTLVRPKAEFVIEEIIFETIESLTLTIGELLELEDRSVPPTASQLKHDENANNLPIEFVGGVSIIGQLRRAEFGAIVDTYLVLDVIPKKLQQKFPVRVRDYSVFLRIHGENAKDIESVYKELLEEFYKEIDWDSLNEKQKRICKFVISKTSKENIIKINLSASTEIGINIPHLVDEVIFKNKLRRKLSKIKMVI